VWLWAEKESRRGEVKLEGEERGGSLGEALRGSARVSAVAFIARVGGGSPVAREIS